MEDYMNMFGDLQQTMGWLQEMEKAAASRSFKGESGGGLVKATVNGKMEIIAMKIAPEAMDPQDPAILEDLVCTAVNRAVNSARESMASGLTSSLMGGS